MGPACPGVLPGPQEQSVWGLLAPGAKRMGLAPGAKHMGLAPGAKRMGHMCLRHPGPTAMTGGPLREPRTGEQLVLRTWQGDLSGGPLGQSPHPLKVFREVIGGVLGDKKDDSPVVRPRGHRKEISHRLA